jgi:NAD-dependent dihydropyrimidine dehydrogenase PreA subunit
MDVHLDLQHLYQAGRVHGWMDASRVLQLAWESVMHWPMHQTHLQSRSATCLVLTSGPAQVRTGHTDDLIYLKSCRITACPDMSQIIVLSLVPATRGTDTAFFYTRFVIPAVRRTDGHFFSSLSAQHGHSRSFTFTTVDRGRPLPKQHATCQKCKLPLFICLSKWLFRHI